MNKLLKKIDSIDFSGKRFKAFIFIVVALIMFSFFYVRTKTSFDGTTKELKNTSVIKLEKGVELKQQLPSKKMKLKGIQLQFDTFGKGNKGILHIKLYEEDSLIKEWEFDSGRLPGLEYNNGYYSFGLNELYSTDVNKDYYFTVSQDYDGDNAIGICTTNDNTLCYKVMSTDTSLRTTVLVLAIIIFAAIVAMVLLNVDERIIMATMLASFGIIYFWLCPVGMAPDETNHFYRAFEISQGGLISKHMGESGVGGNTFPAALKEYRDSKAELNWDETEDYKFGNTSLYSAISYLPQATGIKIADIFTDNVKAIFYGGRIGNFIVSMILCILALWIIPFGRKVLFMVMMFPLTIQEMISMSTDGFTIGLSFMLLAYILYVSYREKNLGKKEVAIVTALCVALSLTKIIYVVLVLLVFMIPNKKLGEGKKWALFKFGVPAVCVILNLAWLVISSGYLVEFRPGVNSAAQVKYILTHIHLYYATAVSTTMETGMYFVETMFGTYMGQLDIAIVPMMWVTFLVLFVYEIVDSRDIPVKAHKYDMFLVLFVFLACMALLYTSLYVQWTPLQNPSIEGIQGRYFIPIIPLLALGCMYGINSREVRAGNTSRYQKKASYYFVFLALLNGITVLDMILYYLCE